MKRILFFLFLFLQVHLMAQINPTAAIMPSPQDSMVLLSKLAADGNYRYHPTLLADLIGSSGQDNLGNHTATQELDMAGLKIINGATPTAVNDIATKSYVDNHTDADSNPTNEVETWSTLAGIPADIADGDDTGIGAIEINEVAYSANGTTVRGNSTFVFDGNNLGVGVSTPETTLHVNNRIYAKGYNGPTGFFAYSNNGTGTWGGMYMGGSKANFIFQNGKEFNIQEAGVGVSPLDNLFPSKTDHLTVASGGLITIASYQSFDFLGTTAAGLLQGGNWGAIDLSLFNNDIGAGNSIFNADGSLSENRLFTIDGYSLNITSGTNGGFLFADPDRGKVGFTDGTNTSQVDCDANSMTLSQTGTGSTAFVDISKEQITIDGQLRQIGKLSPSNLTATTHDWNPTGLSTAYKIRVNMTSPQSITGIAAQEDGVRILIYNVSTQDLTLEFLDGGSLSANRFKGLPGYLDYVVSAGVTVEIIYDDTDSGWTLISN